MIGGECEAQPPLPREKVRQIAGEITSILNGKEAFLAQMQKLVGKLKLAQTAVMGKVGRVALRPLYDMLIRGGRLIDEGPRWA